VEVNVMGSMRVDTVMRPPRRTVPATMHFSELLDVIETSVDTTFPVISEDGELVGILSYQDIRSVMAQGRNPEMDALLVAGDIATPEPVVVRGEQNLNDAMRQFGVRDLSMLPVVDTAGKRLLGVLHRRDVLNAYRRALLERQVPDLEGKPDAG
jgi:CIC family chloride channel protein